MRNRLKCPKCGHPQYCPCKACQKRTPYPKPWIWRDGDHIECGGCGHTEYAYWWMEQAQDKRLLTKGDINV